MLQVVEVEVSKLKPWSENPRLNDSAVEAVSASIRTFGFNVPILCDQKLHIISGHTRWKAAKQLGLIKVPVIMLGLTGKDKRAFSIADNKTSDLAGWDFPKLREILEELRSEDVDLGTLGYSEPEIKALLEPEEDFDWSAFDERLQDFQQSDEVLFPVKIQRSQKELLQSTIAEKAQ